ncbi:MAG: glycosyltransferase family 4 protein [Bacteroidetes bacterium]|nr:glycosyltransferase family 4 protein [Bacteroidota bacterium]
MKRILILYSHFPPAFKGGGPIQSLANLVELLQHDFQIRVVCSAYDLQETQLLKGIVPDVWNSYLDNVEVFYATGSGGAAVIDAIRVCNTDIIFINGIFLPVYNWLPLIWINKKKQRVIMSPRGMLHTGALAVKPIKKIFFLKLFKFFRLHKGILWHATDAQEREDIKKTFGENALVTVAANIPKHPVSFYREGKKVGALRMVFLSLITEKKNLHIVLEALKLLKTRIHFDIYGPVKDHYYWQKCQRLFQKQIHEITYRGLVNPTEVQRKLSEYDLFILPSKGENFGHAIYEALSVGTPVLLSKYTPWGDVQMKNAGVTIANYEVKSWASGINQFVEMGQEEHSIHSQGATELAKDYFNSKDFKSEYLKLFLS